MSELNLVTSSNLEKAIYDFDTKDLVVEFKNGTAYRYFNFERKLWDEFSKTFKADGSAGKFFSANIKNLANEKI